MASKREQVLCAVHALLKGALELSDVARNRDKPKTISPGGNVIMRDGDPGPPQVDLSPPSYNYEHRIPLEVAVAKGSLDELLIAIGEAVEADRSLGGLCDYLDVEAPALDEIDALGAATQPWVEAAIIAFYATSNPLT